MKQIPAIILAAGLTAAPGIHGRAHMTAHHPVQARAATGLATITARDMMHRLSIIADDSMRGRDTPSPGLEMTAAYIAAQFRAFGLRSAGDSGNFIQRYPMRIGTSRKPETALVPNVVGILEGSDSTLRDEYVVFSAHMDHIGTGVASARIGTLEMDSIYNGADDDGTGTTAIIALAHAFASLPVRPARSIIFLTVSGEEEGLFGSTYFTSHLPVKSSRIVADINIDMIGRNNPDSVTAVGMEYTSLGALARATGRQHPELHLVVAEDRTPQERLFERSDHFNFALHDIPPIFFTTGLHEDYHRPSDEVTKIDGDKLARVTRLVYHIGSAVADSPKKPSWTPAGIDEMRARRGR